ncbi:MAG: FtsX-like permease family protein, partial [Clostridiales bacterium]|nr:FtsX-like permease family protein [Clostridiales bacterium]
GEYNYASTTKLTIYGMDLQTAEKMKFLQNVKAGDGEILLSSAFAAEFGYKAGDTIVLHDRAKNEVVLTVSAILPKDNKNPLLAGNKAVVNMKTGDLLSCREGDVSVVLVDLLDDSRIEEVERIVKETYPDATVSNMALSEDDLEAIGELRAFLYLLFAILFLLVIFVTASISNRIVSERMSFIGTLRSLGMSARKTGCILILENVLYALLGSIPATLLYLPIRLSLLLSMFTVESDQGALAFELPAISPFLPIGVVLVAVLVECLIPLRAILLALKTSIRDIIFDNRDTEYRFSRTLTVTGLVFLGIALITFFLRTKLIFATICLLSTVTSLALLFPVVLKFVSGLIGKLAEKTGNASWSLASVETFSRKSTVGSGVLLATASAMCVIIFSIAGSMSESMSHVDFRCDAVITCSKPAKYYTYVDHLEGVTETEKYYSSMESITTDKDTTPFMSTIQGYPEGGYRLYENYEELPQRIENGTVYIDSRYAENAGYKVGDKITVTFRPKSVLPITKEYTIAGIIHTSTLEGGKACLFFSEEEYKLILNDKPYYILVKCENPEKLVTMIKTYAADTVSSVTTYEEEVISAAEEASQFTTIMGILIAAAIGMTCIGAVCNQLIGFTGRKKECA